MYIHLCNMLITYTSTLFLSHSAQELPLARVPDAKRIRLMTDRTSGASRFYKSAVATSALPFLALGSTAAAAPAVADAPSTYLGPRPATPANVAAVAKRIQSSLTGSKPNTVPHYTRTIYDN